MQRDVMLRRREATHSKGLVHPWAPALGRDHMMLAPGVPAIQLSSLVFISRPLKTPPNHAVSPCCFKSRI